MKKHVPNHISHEMNCVQIQNDAKNILQCNTAMMENHSDALVQKKQQSSARRPMPDSYPCKQLHATGSSVRPQANWPDPRDVAHRHARTHVRAPQCEGMLACSTARGMCQVHRLSINYADRHTCRSRCEWRLNSRSCHGRKIDLCSRCADKKRLLPHESETCLLVS